VLIAFKEEYVQLLNRKRLTKQKQEQKEKEKEKEKEKQRQRKQQQNSFFETGSGSPPSHINTE